MARKKIINPGQRQGDFFKMKDFAFEVDKGREYIEQDVPQTVWVYSIDRIKSKTDELYGETYADEKICHPPVEITVQFNVEESETVFLGDGGFSKEYAGNLTFTVYNTELVEKKIDVLRGDFIGLVDANNKMRFYEVNKNNKVNTANKNTLAGIESFYRKVECSVVDKDVFAG